MQSSEIHSSTVTRMTYIITLFTTSVHVFYIKMQKELWILGANIKLSSPEILQYHIHVSDMQKLPFLKSECVEWCNLSERCKNSSTKKTKQILQKIKTWSLMFLLKFIRKRHNSILFFGQVLKSFVWYTDDLWTSVWLRIISLNCALVLL